MTRQNDAKQIAIEVFQPLVRADGGELFLVALSDQVMVLHIAGKLAGCPGNSAIVERVFRPALAAAVPGVRLKVTWGVSVPPGSLPLE